MDKANIPSPLPSGDLATDTHRKPTFIVAPEGLFRYYSNSLHLNWSLYDVKMSFGQLYFTPGDPASSTLTIEQGLEVTLAWAEAKALRDELSDLISRYEKVNGEIVPPKLAPLP